MPLQQWSCKGTSHTQARQEACVLDAPIQTKRHRQATSTSTSLSGEQSILLRMLQPSPRLHSCVLMCDHLSAGRYSHYRFCAASCWITPDQDSSRRLWALIDESVSISWCHCCRQWPYTFCTFKKCSKAPNQCVPRGSSSVTLPHYLMNMQGHNNRPDNTHAAASLYICCW